MDEIDKQSWRSAIKGLRILGEKMLKEEEKEGELIKDIILPEMRKHEIKDIKRAIKFAKKLV